MSTTTVESTTDREVDAAPADEVPATSDAGTSRWNRVRYPVGLFAKVAVLLYAVSWFSIEFLDRHPTYPKPPASFRAGWLLEGWFRWDGNWYQLIASDGYFFTPGKQSSVAFFPAYPMAIKAVNVVLHDVIFSAIVVSVLCGLTAVVLFYRWCTTHASVATARLSVLVFVVYPYAWYLFGAVYADALFVAAAIGAFVLLERGHPVLAGIVGAIATAARPVGLGVLVGLVAVLLEQRGVVRIAMVERIQSQGWGSWRGSVSVASTGARAETTMTKVRRIDLRRLRLRDVGVLLAAAGLAVWCFYLWRTWGNPLLFAETEGAPGWDQAAGFHTWLKVEWFEHLGMAPTWLHDSIWRLDVRGYSPWSQFMYTVGLTLQALFVFGALALLPRILRRLGWGYALYVLVVVGIPLLGSKDFQGSGRYMLAAFPCFFVVGEWLQSHSRWRHVWLPVSAVMLVFWTSLFARGYYVA